MDQQIIIQDDLAVDAIMTCAKKRLSDYFLNETEWEWITAGAFWSRPLADLCGIARKATSALASLFRAEVTSGRPCLRGWFFRDCAALWWRLEYFTIK